MTQEDYYYLDAIIEGESDEENLPYICKMIKDLSKDIPYK